MPVLVVLAAAVAIYLGAFIVNAFLHHATVATFILILGGGAAITALVGVTAFSGRPLDTAQASLFYLAIVLEAGLLVASGVTFLIAVATTTLTAAALLFALSLGPAVTRRDAYLIIVYTLSLQALVSLISWLLAQALEESRDESQRAQELRFAQARFEALRGQTDEQRRQLLSGIGAIQLALGRVFGGEYSAEIDVPDGDLSDLANSINLLLRRIETAAQTEQELVRRDAALGPFMSALGQMADPATPEHAPLESASIAASHSQANMAYRLAKVRKLASEVAGAVGHSHVGLSSATEEVAEAQRIAGVLISMADAILGGTQKQFDLVTRARRALSGLLPAEMIRDEAQRDVTGLDPEEAAKLRGLGVHLGLATGGLTAEFQALPPPASQDEKIAPMTVPLTVVDGAPPPPPPTVARADGMRDESERMRQSEHGSGARPTPLIAMNGTGDPVPPAVLEVWYLLLDIATEVGQEERGVGNLARDLGVLSRAMRQADVGMAWVLQALDAVRRDAEQLQQAAGFPLPPPDPTGARSATPSRPMTPGTAQRAPQLSRPLSEEPPPPSVGMWARAPSRPLSEEPPADHGPLPEAADEPGQGDGPAPGSLRAADLINLDDLPGADTGL